MHVFFILYILLFKRKIFQLSIKRSEEEKKSRTTKLKKNTRTQETYAYKHTLTHEKIESSKRNENLYTHI